MWVTDLLVSLCVPACALVGAPAVVAFSRRSNTALDFSTGFAAALALGLLCVQAGGMLFGFLHVLSGAALAAWGVVMALGAIGWWWRLGRPWWRGRPSLPSAPGVLTCALFAAYLLMATVPPWQRDEMSYHLSLPRAFAGAGGFVVPDDNIFASFPLGFETILAALHRLGEGPDYFAPFNPRLVGAWVSLGVALATVGLARAVGATPLHSRWAAPMVLLVPTFVEFGPSAYAEPYLMLLSTLALVATLQTLGGHRASLWPAALFAGAAANAKYPGLAVCLFLAMLLSVSVLRSPPAEQPRALRDVALFAALAGLVAAPFYVRNLLERGNPFFPVAYGLFGGAGWDDWRADTYALTLEAYGMGRGLSDFVLLPFRLFTTRALHTGFEGSLGPVPGLGLVAGVALVAGLARGSFGQLPRRAVVGATLFATLWSLLWMSTVQQVRYSLVAVPVVLALLLAAVRVVSEAHAALGRAVLATLVCGALGWTAPLAAHLWDRQHTSDWLLGRTSREALLATLLPESYPVWTEVERLVPPDGKVWLLWMRTNTYYLRRPYREDMVFEAWRFEALLDRVSEPRQLVAELRRERITHLLVHGQFFLIDGAADLVPDSTERTDRLRARFDRAVADGLLVPVSRRGPITLYAVAGP